MKWKIYYGDGSTFSSEQGSPLDAPAANIQAVVEWTGSGSRVVCERDFYLFIDGQWQGADIHGVVDQFSFRGLLKEGRTLADERYDAIMQHVRKDTKV